MARAGFQLGLDLVKRFLRASSGDLLVQLGEDDGAGGQRAGPVRVDGFAVHAGLDGVDVVRSPVNAGGNDIGVGADGSGGAVVGDVGDTGGLAGGRSTEGVGVLADKLAAVLDQLLSAFLLSSLVVPAAGEGDFHRDGRADGACAQEEGGVAGDNFRVGERADIAHLGLVCGELTVLDHLVELHTGGDASQITALIDGGESVVVVGKALGVRLGAGGVAELHVGEFLGGLDHVVLVTKGVGKDDVAAGVSQLSGLVVALLAFGNVGDQRVLNAQRLAGFLGGVDEVQVVGGVFIMQSDEADLEALGNFRVLSRGLGRRVLSRGLGGRVLSRGLGGRVVRRLRSAGDQRKHHDERQQQSKNLFHFVFLLKKFLGLSQRFMKALKRLSIYYSISADVSIFF